MKKVVRGQAQMGDELNILGESQVGILRSSLKRSLDDYNLQFRDYLLVAFA